MDNVPVFNAKAKHIFIDRKIKAIIKEQNGNR
jgi:hypothetical protein